MHLFSLADSSILASLFPLIFFIFQIGDEAMIDMTHKGY